ncbi:unnamed protein product [Sphagnum jensenii]|uniref:Uncharacterized protein n=1 Tax=Sphagnum jensenii TaxID=128206 RepID=A0ABP0XBA6_9BRYO
MIQTQITETIHEEQGLILNPHILEPVYCLRVWVLKTKSSQSHFSYFLLEESAGKRS